MSEPRSRRTVKARFDPAVFERMNDIRRARGLGWADVVAHGVVAVEEEVPPIHERFETTADDDGDDR